MGSGVPAPRRAHAAALAHPATGWGGAAWQLHALPAAPLKLRQPLSLSPASFPTPPAVAQGSAWLGSGRDLVLTLPAEMRQEERQQQQAVRLGTGGSVGTIYMRQEEWQQQQAVRPACRVLGLRQLGGQKGFLPACCCSLWPARQLAAPVTRLGPYSKALHIALASAAVAAVVQAQEAAAAVAEQDAVRAEEHRLFRHLAELRKVRGLRVSPLRKAGHWLGLIASPHPTHRPISPPPPTHPHAAPP